MKHLLRNKDRLVQHIIKNHIGYTMGALVMLTSTLVYADYKIPDFHAQKSHLQGNLLEVMLNTYEPPQVLLPTAGESYTLGEVMPIAWQGKGKETNLYLIPKNQDEKVLMIEKYVKGKEFHWQTPVNLEAGHYRVGIKNGSDLAKSKGFFTLKKPDQPDANAKKEEPQPVLTKKEDEEQRHSSSQIEVDQSPDKQEEEHRHRKNSDKFSSDHSDLPKLEKELQGNLLEAQQKNRSDRFKERNEEVKTEHRMKERENHKKREHEKGKTQKEEKTKNAESHHPGMERAKEKSHEPKKEETQIEKKGDKVGRSSSE